jgi:hypothetical protein
MISRFQDTGCKPWTPQVRQPLLTGLLLKLPEYLLCPFARFYPRGERGTMPWDARYQAPKGSRYQQEPSLQCPTLLPFRFKTMLRRGCQAQIDLVGPLYNERLADACRVHQQWKSVQVGANCTH